MKSKSERGSSRRRGTGGSGQDGTGRAGVDPALRELLEISRAVGGDPDWVQGGGGNTSVKSRDGRRMFVKASGAALARVDEHRGWAELDLAATRRLLDADVASLSSRAREAAVLRLLEAAVLRPDGARPSVESSLHALLDRVVIHTHPVGLNAFLCARDSRHQFAALFKGLGVKPLYVPYVDPGFTLALRLRKELEAHVREIGSAPSVILLENHGLFVARPTVKECLALTRKVTSRGQRWIERQRVNPLRFPFVVNDAGGSAPAELRGALLRAGAGPLVVRRDSSSEAAALAGSKTHLREVRKGAFTPDQIVYCGTMPLVLPSRNHRSWQGAVEKYRERRGHDPRVVIVPDDDIYYAAADLGQVKVISEVFRSAATAFLATARAGGPRLLSRSQARFIEEWEVESFRAASWAGRDASLKGRIALITGAGSGLGKGIATEIVASGATVVALDVDESALAAVAGELPEGRYLPVRCDVTDEESVRAAVATAERSVGGLDFLVNAAGIAPSAPLVDFPLAAWKKTLDINLTGYFLCAREAARCLLRQDAGGAIVNITSKSGLEASKDNSAYNATKAGEIHLMRGWAMELGRAGIRVNCVAPGNVFKGSRIWNDEYIRACARKKGIRPEEVIPYYTSLSPLGREIEPRDVAAAVVFLLSDEARNVTGQTLVVDGGQVMVR